MGCGTGAATGASAAPGPHCRSTKDIKSEPLLSHQRMGSFMSSAEKFASRVSPCLLRLDLNNLSF